jgi:hypothetical protein
MNSCPESEKIQALRSGSLSAEEARLMQSHIATCPACRQELEVETAIDRELALDIHAPKIEDSVLRGLKILGLAEAEDRGHDFYKYLLYAVLIVVFGFLIMPYLLHLPPLRIGQLFSPDRLRPLFSVFRSNLPVTIGIGFALLSVSLLFSFPQLRKVFEL